jgi:hypothetical protein
MTPSAVGLVGASQYRTSSQTPGHGSCSPAHAIEGGPNEQVALSFKTLVCSCGFATAIPACSSDHDSTEAENIQLVLGNKSRGTYIVP